MAVEPSFAAVPRSIDKASVSAANTNRDGSGTIVTLATGAVAGTRIMRIVVKAEVTTTAGMARIFISTDSGATWDLYDEIIIPANTVSASNPASRVSRDYSYLVLYGVANRIGVTLEKAEAHDFFALGADL